MARNSFNFQAVLKLRTDEFRKGVRDVQKSINGLKQTFLSFAGGLGLTMGLDKFVSALKDTSVKIDTAKNVLKNVSETTMEYAENLNFLRDISDKYGQDLIVLINNFGQFRAAAKSSKLEIDDLRKIYESLTRAAGAYHMSADRTNDMMVAVTQMFSKGKIAAEELRRQLGNSLPGAFNLMAKAAQLAGITANGTTGELEDLMRKGKVLADDVMPSFAAVLDEVTAKSSFDSLQQSLNRLKNSWTSFVEQANFGQLYEKMVKGLGGALGFLARNMDWVKASLLGLAAGLTASLGKHIWKKSQSNIEAWRVATASALDGVAKRSKDTKKALDDLLKQKKDLASYRSGKGSTASWFEATATGAHYKPQKAKFEKINGANVISNIPDNYKEAAQAALNYNNALLAQNDLYKKIGMSALLTKKQVKQLAVENKAYTQIIATQGQTYVASLSKADVFFKKIGASFKAFMAANWIPMAIAGITIIATKIAGMVKHARELKNLTENTVNAVRNDLSVESERIGKLEEIKKVLKDNEKGTAEWNGALNAANDLMGLVGDKAFTAKSNVEDIVYACDEWIGKLKKIAYQEAIIAKIQELAAENITLQSEVDRIKSKPGARLGYQKVILPYEGPTPEKSEIETKIPRRDQKEIDDKLSRIASNAESIKQLLKMEDPDHSVGGEFSGPNPLIMDEEAIRRALGIREKTTTTTGGGGGEKTKVGEINDIFDKFDENVEKLKNQLKAGAITAKEFDDEYKKLVDGSYKAISEYGDLNDYLKEFEKNSKEDIEKINERFKDLADTFAYLNGKADTLDWVKETIKDLKKEIAAKDIYNGLPTEPNKRDTTFDYKKGDKEKYREEQRLLENLIEEWEKAKEKIAELGAAGVKELDKVDEKINSLKASAQNFQQLANLAEMKEDVAAWKKEIEDLSKTYNDSLYNGVQNVASSMDRLYRLYVEVAEAFGAEIDKDNGFAKVLTVVTALIEAFETVYTLIQAITKVREAAAEVEKARNNAEMQALEQQIAMTGALGAAEVAAKGAATIATQKQAGAQAQLAAAEVAGAAGAASETSMKLPFPYNLAALAASIGAIIAAFAAVKGLSKFAKGGIVGGNSTTGDNNVIRANSGEMILTKAQQGTLFNMLNGKGGLGGGNVEFKIRGTDLVGTLNNYNQKRRG